MRDTLAAVIVRYNPPPGFDDRVASAAAQADLTVVVDNGSSSRWSPDPSRFPEGATLYQVHNAENLGIATALNQGIRLAAQQGAASAFLLDHDSVPLAGCVRQLQRTLRADDQDSIAAVVPHILYGHPDIQCRWPATRGKGRRLFFRFVYAAGAESPQSVDLAISSGMLLDIAHWQALGGFDDGLFIDLVDTDYCLRARRQGLRVLAEPRARIQHSLGEVQKRRLFGRLAAYPTHHSALRHYYISRNRMTLLRRHALRFPSWAVYETLGAAKLITKVVAFESHRREKIAATLTGSWDGLRGRRGPRP
ncbi:glycosyltransferase family 2 protein [Algiphilus sp.]|uniref:glycosyltransferase family 2 protein n=1 Tax=Algiphilus sp. TaxID=1872431 RepID=UPI003B5271CF